MIFNKFKPVNVEANMEVQWTINLGQIGELLIVALTFFGGILTVSGKVSTLEKTQEGIQRELEKLTLVLVQQAGMSARLDGLQREMDSLKGQG